MNVSFEPNGADQQGSVTNLCARLSVFMQDVHQFSTDNDACESNFHVASSDSAQNYTVAVSLIGFH